MNKHGWTHNSLTNDLYHHLLKPERMLWCDVPIGPSGSVRPDVFSMRKSFTKPRPIAYEVKVSVADFRSDVTSGKWQSYLEIAQGVIFACPQGMIKKEDLPNGCGLMIRSDKGWTTTKGPTLDKFKSLPEKVYLKLLMSLGDKIERDIKSQIDFTNKYQIEQRLRQSVGKEVSDFIRRKESAQKELQETIEKRKAIEEEIENYWRELAEAVGLERSNKWAVKDRIKHIVEGTLDYDVTNPPRKAAQSAISSLERFLERLPND